MNESIERSALRKRLFALITRMAPDCEDELDDDADLLADLGFESVQLLELVSAVEAAFGIEMDEGEIAPIRTISELLDALAAAGRRMPRELFGVEGAASAGPVLRRELKVAFPRPVRRDRG